MVNVPWVKYLPGFLGERLRNRPLLQAILGNGGWLFVDKAVRILLGLLVGAWAARYLGPEQYGQLAYVLAYIAFFRAIANLGADGIIVRDIARNRNAAPHILGSELVLRLVAGILCWIVAVGGAALISGGDNRQIWMTAVVGGILVFQAADTIDLWFQSQSQSRRTVLAKLVAQLISNGVMIALILSKAPLIAFATAMLLDTAATAISLAIAYHRYPTQGKWRVLRHSGAKLLRESWPYMLSGLSIMVYMRIDQIMLKEMLGDKDLGLYAAAVLLSSVWQIIPMILATSLAPVISRKKAESQQAYMETLASIFRLFAALGLLVSLPVAVFAGPLVSLLYGEAYSQAADVLRIHVLSNIFVNLGVAQGLWLVNEGNGRMSLYKTVIGAITCVLGNFILIPMLGLKGAAWATVFAQFVSAVASNLIFAPQILKLQIMGLLQLKVSR